MKYKKKKTGKLSSYQKLKKENKELKEDLYNIIMKPDSYEGKCSAGRRRFEFEMAEIVMRGGRRVVMTADLGAKVTHESKINCFPVPKGFITRW